MIAAGGVLTTTITVTNNGPSDAQNVSLSDLLPAGTTLITQTQIDGPEFTLGNSGNRLRPDTIATLPSGFSADFSVTARVAPQSDHRNRSLPGARGEQQHFRPEHEQQQREHRPPTVNATETGVTRLPL